jgi:hypothetical protein
MDKFHHLGEREELSTYNGYGMDAITYVTEQAAAFLYYAKCHLGHLENSKWVKDNRKKIAELKEKIDALDMPSADDRHHRYKLSPRTTVQELYAEVVEHIKNARLYMEKVEENAKAKEIEEVEDFAIAMLESVGQKEKEVTE